MPITLGQGIIPRMERDGKNRYVSGDCWFDPDRPARDRWNSYSKRYNVAVVEAA